MAEAKRDNNFVPTLLAVNNSDNSTPVVLWADPTTHRLLVDVSGGSGTSSIDDAAFTAGSDSGTPAMGYFSTDTVDAGDVGVLAMDASRRLFVSIEADNVGIGGGTQYAVDTALGATPTGTLAIGIRDDALSALTPIEGDAVGLRVDANGALWVIPSGTVTIAGAVTNAGTFAVQVDSSTLPTGAATAGNQTTLLGYVDGIEGLLTTIDADTSTLAAAVAGTEMQVDVLTLPGIAGDVAHDTADSGNPIKVGVKAYAFDGTAPQTAVAEADRVNLISDLQGILYSQISHPMFWHVSADYASAQTNATVKAAPGASLKLYITDVIVSNGAVAGNITLLDGSGGTVLLELYPAINGGLTHSFRNPLVLTANTLLAITSTTVTTHSVTIAGFIAA